MEGSGQNAVIALAAAGLGASVCASAASAAAEDEDAVPSWVDPHFHFLDPVQNPEQHATLLSAHPDLTPYLPEDYQRDFANLKVAKSVHMEVIPDDFAREVEWVQSMKDAGRCPWVGGIVAAADPSAENFAEVLAACAKQTNMLKGIRWILNYVRAALCRLLARGSWASEPLHWLWHAGCPGCSRC
jgi:predicted TIM-barrel fold metal-dependent hydrolase